VYRGVTYGFGIVASAYGHDGAAAREPPALVAMLIIAHPALIRIAANDPHGGGSRTAAPHGAPWPETIRHTLSARKAMHTLFDLSGQVALVTGGDKGLGQAMAIALAQAGADVAVASRRGQAEASLAGIAAAGWRGLALAADLASDPVEPLVSETVAQLGRLDIVINNAGTIRRSPALETAPADWQHVIDVNLHALWALSQAAARVMIQQRRGKIINIASLLSFQGGVRVPAYTAAKHAVAGLTKALANEWAAQGINVNAIAPGYMVTDNTQALRDDPERSRQILERIPAGRWGTPADLTGAALFLASSASDYVHGHVLVVDGGWLAR
jgi:2-dehydro-3-deoxy-D-gluconate 5-dehydrogenase